MTVGAVVLLVVLACGPLALMALTTTGARRRGSSWPLALGAGLLFPVTWVAWHIVD